MAINDRKIEKLKERSAQLEKRIKEDTVEKKRIDTQIKVLSYENLRAELSSHAMTADDYVQYAKLLQKMADHSVSFADIDAMLDKFAESHIQTENKENFHEENKIF